MQAILNHLLVRPDPVKEKTPGGVILPQGTAEKSQVGTVVSTGQDVKYVKDGDNIVYSKYTGVEVVINGEKLLVIRQEDVLIVL
jgi:chaperonin GroES